MSKGLLFGSDTRGTTISLEPSPSGEDGVKWTSPTHPVPWLIFLTRLNLAVAFGMLQKYWTPTSTVNTLTSPFCWSTQDVWEIERSSSAWDTFWRLWASRPPSLYKHAESN